MKNKLIITLTITIFMCTACGKAIITENKTNNITTETTQVASKENNGKDEQQFQIMSEKIENAFEKEPEEYSEDFPYRYYTVTDLDQNGRLELIISSGMQGTGLFTYSQIYEINEDGTKLKKCIKNDEFMDDIVDGIDRAYYDKKSDTYYYVTEDITRNGGIESGIGVNALSLNDGKITSDCIAYQYVYIDVDTDKQGEEYCKYVNGEKKKITAKEYNPEKIEKEYFMGMKKKKVKIYWNKFKKKSKEESVAELLKECYKKFKLK